MYRFPNLMRATLILLMAYVPLSSSAYASQLNCNGHLVASVGSSCDLDITVDVLIQGTYDLSILTFGFYSGNTLVDLSSDASAFLGHTLTFKVTDTTNGNHCWGDITIEDKAKPVLDCGPCSDPTVTDPSCMLRCPSYELFSAYDKFSGKIGYATELLDKIIVSDPQTFINKHVSDNCGQAVTASYVDGFVNGECGIDKRMVRTWTVAYSTPHGPESLQCKQYYAFKPFEFYDTAGAPIVVEGDGTLIENHILLPINHITIPSCHHGITPADIAAYFDDPATLDMDSDGDGAEPEVDVDCVIEHNEGIPYGYPHYYMPGLGTCEVAGGGEMSAMCYPLHPQPIIDKICNLNVFYSDYIFEACAVACSGNIKISRTWTIMNWCNGDLFEYVQNIEVADGIAPEILVKDITASVDPWQCAADVQVPRPEHLRDNCDENLTYKVQLVDQANIITGNTLDGYLISAVPPGIYQVMYESSDCCGNTTKEYVSLQVLDATPPVAVTIENIVLDLTYTELGVGTGKLHAYDVDNQSYDACGPVTVEIRRGKTFCNPQDTLWGDHVSFCCTDLQGQEYQLIDVQFRVMDWLGNTNELWTTVRLEGKGGVLVCPPDMVVSCTTDYHDFSNTGGIPISYTSCSSTTAIVDTLVIRDNTRPSRKAPTTGNVPGYTGVEVEAYNPACGFGAIKREFDQCTQWLVVEPIDEVFDPSTIQFPDDVTVDCVDVETGEPVFMSVKCNLVGFTLDSDTFRIEGNSCAQIINEFSVIDWCTYDMTSGEGKYTHTQIVNVVDNTIPQVITEEVQVYVADENCMSNGVVLTAIGIDEATCDAPWLSWEVEVDIDDDFQVEYIYSSAYPRELPSGEPNPFYLEKTTSGDQLKVVLPDGIIASKEQHRINWIIDDGCRNVNQIRTYFVIEDQKAPTPYCLNLSTAVMTNGEVELWAIDFNQSSFDNCAEQTDLLFTFTDVPPPPRCDAEYGSANDLLWYDGTYWFYDASEVDTDVQECGVTGAGEYEDIDSYGGDVHRWEPGLKSSGKIFTTADDEDKDGILEIPIYVWDECQNIDFCTVTLRISDNAGGAMIGGNISTPAGEVIGNMRTQLMANMPNYPKTVMTDSQGQYVYPDNTPTMDYEISGGSQDDYLNGVSTLDLIMIQRHILGIESFDSPYDYVAADINGDNKINGIDLVELRKLILGIYTDLPQNNSWKLLDADQVLTVTDPWNYKESIFVTGLAADMQSEDFIGVKIGDLNKDVLLRMSVEPTIARQSLNFSFTDRIVNAGEEFEVKVESSSKLQGFQMGLFIPQLDFIGLSGSGFSDQNFHYEDAHLAISQHESTNGEDGIMTLTFRAKQSDKISALISMDASFANEAYMAETLDKTGISLGHQNDIFLKLLQNNPNPFMDHTFVRYELMNDTEVEIVFYQPDGTIVKKTYAEGAKGLNQVKIGAEDLSAGIIYCKVIAGSATSVIKMLNIK